MTSTTPATTALPQLSSRVRAVRSSVIRDLLALTERPGVISFAGGLPAPELFDLEGACASFDAVLSADAGHGPSPCSTPPPRATGRCGPRSPSGTRRAACPPTPRTS